MNRRILAALAVLCLAAVVAVPAVYAQTTTVVTPPADVVVVPWGSWLAGVLGYLKEIIISAVIAIFAILARKLPASIVSVLEAAKVEQLLKNAVEYAIAAVDGAVKDKTLDVNTTNAILHTAAQYAVTNAPALATKLGDTLLPKLLARMSAAGVVSPDASVANVAAPLPAPSVSVSQVVNTPAAT